MVGDELVGLLSLDGARLISFAKPPSEFGVALDKIDFIKAFLLPGDRAWIGMHSMICG